MDSHSYLGHRESGHYRYREPWVTSRSHPVDFLLIWVVAGNMDATVGGRGVSAGPGDLVLLEPDVPHRYAPRVGRDWEWFWVHLSGAGASDLWTRLAGAAGPVRPLGLDGPIRDRFTELVTTAATSIRPGPSIHADTCAASLLGLMVERLEAQAEPGQSSSAQVSALTTWILDHLDTPIGLPDLVRESGWSAAQLNRTVRREVGVAPMQYVTRLRIRRAQRLLTDTELDVTQVARVVGFRDPLHFSRRFRQLVGQPPSQVRRTR